MYHKITFSFNKQTMILNYFFILKIFCGFYSMTNEIVPNGKIKPKIWDL